ncbi:MAG: type II toxin-antitoxin system VapC family toxin [bacterium]
MGVLIDTSVIIDFERNKRDITPFIRDKTDEEFFLSVISASEFLHGVHRAKDPGIRSRRLAFVEAVLNTFPIIHIDLPTARIHAELWSHLESQGKMIGLHDSWLAAICLAHNLSFITKNKREFDRVPGLEVETWI